MFREQYPLFGDAEVMSMKVIWDYTYYWGVLCLLVFQNRLTDVALLGAMQKDLAEAAQLNLDMQAFFRRWLALSPGTNRPAWYDQQDLDWFVAMNVRLHETLDDDGVRERLRDNVTLMRDLAATTVARAQEYCPGLDAESLPRMASPATPLFEMEACA
jgi:hypothetical protein